MKKYILMFFVLGLLIMPSVSSATVDEDLIDVDPNPIDSICVSLVYNLRYQSRDATTNGEVSTLQDFLQSKGYLNSEPTGYFGLLTFKAAKDFQSANGIQPTGYVGPITRAKIAALTCGDRIDDSIIISGVSGPQTLKVNQKGTWTVSAYSRVGGNLSYSVDWGEGNDSFQTPSVNSTTQQSATFSHRYSSSGVRTITFTATRENTIQCFRAPCPSNKESAQATLTVNVGGVVTSSAVTVLTPNGGETWKIGSTYTIDWKDNNPTYGQNYTISLLHSTKVFYKNILNNAGDPGIDWTIPSCSNYSECSSDFMIEPGPYFMKICQVNSNICDISDNYFTIAGGTETSNKFLSPTEGNKWKIGQTYWISLTEGLSSDYHGLLHQFNLVDKNNGFVGSICPPYSLNKGDANFSWVAGSLYSACIGTSNVGFNAQPGSYKIVFKELNSNGNTIRTTESKWFYLTNSSSSITVLSPNGGETWTKGATKTIKWSDNTATVVCDNCGAPAPRYYNITLEPYTTPCTTNICPQYPTRSYQIYSTKNLSYSWQVGKTSDGSTIPDGSYTMQVCEATTGVCDTSNSYFKIAGVVAIPVNRAPEIGIFPVPANPSVGQPFNFTANATDADNDNLVWGVDWGGEGASMQPCPIIPTVSSGQQLSYPFSHTWTSAGSYTVKVYVNDCKGGSDETSFTVNVKSVTTTVDIIGTLDVVQCDLIAGWALDRNNKSDSIYVNIYDETNGSRVLLYRTRTTGLRTDVNEAYNVSGNHGFTITTPDSIRDGQSHVIAAYGEGSPERLWNSPKNVFCHVVLGAESFYFTQFLSEGAYGGEVSELQKALNQAGYDAGFVDGHFGLQVKTALMKFQTANGLKPDGIMGYETRTLLNK